MDNIKKCLDKGLERELDSTGLMLTTTNFYNGVAQAKYSQNRYSINLDRHNVVRLRKVGELQDDTEHPDTFFNTWKQISHRLLFQHLSSYNNK